MEGHCKIEVLVNKESGEIETSPDKGLQPLLEKGISF